MRPAANPHKSTVTKITTWIREEAHNQSAAKRRKNKAHGASRGYARHKNAKPRQGRKKMAHTAANLIIHLIFSTKQRQNFILPEIRSDIFAYLGGIARQLQATALIVNGTADHVHMLLRIRTAQCLADVVRTVKTNSSRWIREKWNPKFAWQTGYGAFSVSESNVSSVSKYIATQEAHHKKRSFQQEFLAFLKKNKIGYDERYIWE